jgi:predicted transcriptional regulator
MPPNIDDNSESEKINSKVARLINRYGFGEELGERLEELWTADGNKQESLRSLADRFNRRLLESAINEEGMSVVEGEVDNLYRLLTNDGVSSGNRTEARRRLKQNGVDIEQLEQDFVTYQAIRSYLKEYRGATYERNSSTTRVEKIVETIQRLKSRTRSVADNSLDQRKKSGKISIGEHRLFVEITVLCEDCNTQYGLVELLKNGSCDCETE